VREHTYLKEDEMVQRGIQALMDALGPIETVRFLTLPRQQRIDAVTRHRRWQDGLDKDLFFDQVFGPQTAAEPGQS
jgi:hypothetical protein